MAGEVVWTPLFGGRTNAAWLGQTSAGDFVAKLYSGAALNPLFPNDPNAESMLLHALADTGHTPVFRAQLTTEAGICNLYDHIPGQTWQDGVSDVARLMRTLHMLPCPDGLRTAPDGAAALASQTLGILSKCDTPGELLSVQPASGPSSSGARCLLHSDIVPGNLIRNGNSLHLIDWQCPAVGDPCEDIAIFLSPAMQHLYRGKVLSRADEASFFEAYAVPDIQKRYQALAPFYHWRMAAYCLWQMQNGRSDYAEGLAMERAAFQRSESSKPT